MNTKAFGYIGQGGQAGSGGVVYVASADLTFTFTARWGDLQIWGFMKVLKRMLTEKPISVLEDFHFGS